MADLNSIKPRNRQTGAAAIEFALLFLLFFVLFYALVSYAFVFMLQNAFVHAAEEGARAAISVDPLAYASNSNYINNGVTPEVRNTVGAALDWLPSKAKSVRLLHLGYSQVIDGKHMTGRDRLLCNYLRLEFNRRCLSRCWCWRRLIAESNAIPSGNNCPYQQKNRKDSQQISSHYQISMIGKTGQNNFNIARPCRLSGIIGPKPGKLSIGKSGSLR